MRAAYTRVRGESMSAQIIDLWEYKMRRRPYQHYTSANLRSMVQLARSLGDVPLAYEITKELLYRERARAS